MGVQEINSSITAMDEMTQQNSALVEQSTAAARALSDEAGRLAELMAFFKLDGPRETAKATARSVKRPAARVSTDQQIAHVDVGWSEF
jgi:methyl-accepting chemotaxis protein